MLDLKAFQQQLLITYRRTQIVQDRFVAACQADAQVMAVFLRGSYAGGF